MTVNGTFLKLVLLLFWNGIVSFTSIFVTLATFPMLRRGSSDLRVYFVIMEWNVFFHFNSELPYSLDSKTLMPRTYNRMNIRVYQFYTNYWNGEVFTAEEKWNVMSLQHLRLRLTSGRSHSARVMGFPEF